jgi:hypothetical protein
VGQSEISPFHIPGLLGPEKFTDPDEFTGDILGLLETREGYENVKEFLPFQMETFLSLPPEYQKRIIDRMMSYQEVPASPSTVPSRPVPQDKIYDPAAFMDGTRFFQPLNPLEHRTWVKGLRGA